MGRPIATLVSEYADIKAVIIGLPENVRCSAIYIPSGCFEVYFKDSLFFFPASICLFMAFSQVRVKPNKILRLVAKIAALSFGAYLWTDHNLIRKPFWEVINVSGKYQNNVGKTLIYMIIVVIALILIGIFIEWIRLKLMRLLQLQRFLKKCDDYFEIVKEKWNKPF